MNIRCARASVVSRSEQTGCRPSGVERLRETSWTDPRELRDLIYEFSLVSTESINVCRLAPQPSDVKKLGISIALVRVTRQIHHEAIKVMYGLNTFEARILLDPRLPHSFHHDRMFCDHGKDRTFRNPMIKAVKRLIIRLEFNDMSSWPRQDPAFPEKMLEAFVLRGNLDIIVLKPGCYSSYLESLQHFNATLATANAALAISRGSLFSSYLLSCIDVDKKSTLVVHTPKPQAPFEFLDFPWTSLNSQPATDTLEVSRHIPSRFRSTGQMRSASLMC